MYVCVCVHAHVYMCVCSLACFGFGVCMCILVLTMLLLCIRSTGIGRGICLNLPFIPASTHCRTEAMVLVVLTNCVHPLTIIFMFAVTLLNHFVSFGKCLKCLPFNGPH